MYICPNCKDLCHEFTHAYPDLLYIYYDAEMSQEWTERRLNEEVKKESEGRESREGVFLRE